MGVRDADRSCLARLDRSLCPGRTCRTYPEGMTGLSLGFNPGIHVHYEPALPVRHSSGSMGRRGKIAAENLFQISLGVRLSNNPGLPPLQHPQTRNAGAIRIWRSTPILQHSITPRGRIRGRGRRRGRERSALSPFTSHLLAEPRILNRAQLGTLQRRYRISTIVGCIKGAGTMVA